MSQFSTHAHEHRQIKRGQIDELLILARHLPSGDRTLIEQVLGNGTPVATLAKLHNRSPRQLQRRTVTIVKRMSDKLFRFIAYQMNTLPQDVRLTARYVVLHGLSMRQTARKTGMSLHQVRQHMNIVHATARLLG